MLIANFIIFLKNNFKIHNKFFFYNFFLEVCRFTIVSVVVFGNILLNFSDIKLTILLIKIVDKALKRKNFRLLQLARSFFKGNAMIDIRHPFLNWKMYRVGGK